MKLINRDILLSILKEKRMLCQDVGKDFDKSPMGWSGVLNGLSWDQLSENQVAKFREELVEEAYDLAYDYGQTHECAGCEESFFPEDTIDESNAYDIGVMCEECWDYFFNK